MVVEKAYAKINIFLDVISKRQDGFHDILSIMHAVSLFDTVTVRAQRSEKRVITLRTNSANLPTDNRNIAYRAAEAFLDKSQICSKINIEIDKNIPIGAGLAGGSSDAAAVLRALNKIYPVLDFEALLKIAAELGSDVPFCLLGGTAVCCGRGEQMTSVASPELNLVIAIGDRSVETAKAYAALDKLYSDFSERRGKASFNELLSATQKSDFSDFLYNIFEDVAATEVLELKKRFIELSATASLMSGSGPSVFGIFEDEKTAALACEALLSDGYRAYLAKSVLPSGTL